MLEIMKQLFLSVWKVMDIPLNITNDITVRIWHFWAFALIMKLIFTFIIGGGSKNEVD